VFGCVGLRYIACVVWDSAMVRVLWVDELFTAGSQVSLSPPKKGELMPLS
jgi:hypothetical protein